MLSESNLIQTIASIGIRLGAAEDLTSLLSTILEESIRLTNCDGGSLYLLKDDHLEFEIVKNHSLNINYGGPHDPVVPDYFKPIPMNGAIHNVCVWVAQTQKTANIPDVSSNTDFDFSGTRRADQINNYKSTSFLTVAMKDHESKTVGVLQLINALDQYGTPIPFDTKRQHLVEALSGMAAVAINNHLLQQEMSLLLDSFMSLIAEAIDEKSEYTGEHCRRVPWIVMELAERVHATKQGTFAGVKFTPEDMYELRVASWLHDVGKIAIPEYVVDKATKLETIYDRINEVNVRGDLLRANKREANLQRQLEIYKNASLTDEEKAQKASESEQQLQQEIKEIDEAMLFLRESNVGGEFMNEERQNRVKEIGSWEVQRSNPDGELTSKNFLTGDFIRNLCISRGTLTPEERAVIQNHMQITINMLEKLPFPRHLRRVPEFAGGHHETMIGTGYPRGLRKEDMSVQARMMAIADIFEALTASDRPYKPAKKLSVALDILGGFKKRNHIDPDLFDVFIQEEVYMEYAKEFMASHLIDDVNKEALVAIQPDPV